MPGSFDRSPQGDEHSIYRSWNIKLIALPILVAVALIAYVVSQWGHLISG